VVERDFFFSSRRRHTRWPRDWSSDVCSSDLQHCRRLKMAPLQDPISHLEVNIPLPLVISKLIFIMLGLHQEMRALDSQPYPAGRSEERRVGKEWRARRGRDR